MPVRTSNYPAVRAALAERLRGAGWDDDFSSAAGTFASGGGFTEHTPLVVARREGKALLAQVRSLAPDTSLEAIDVRVDVYDLGVAVITAQCEARRGSRISPSETALRLKRDVWLRPEAGATVPALSLALQQVASETTDQLEAALRDPASRAARRRPRWRRDVRALAAASHDGRSEEAGRLLWLHPVLQWHGAEATNTMAAALAPPFRELVAIDGGTFAAGIGWSAVAHAGPSAGADAAVRLTQLHWAYYALYMEMDRTLLAALDQERWRTSAPLRQLEREADEVFGDYLRVVEARARLDTALAALGGDELAIWETIARVQRFDALVDAVQRKLEILERVAQRRVDQASAHRARRTAEILGGLTALTVVTVAIGLVGYFLGSRSSQLDQTALRVALIVIAFVSALAVYWAAFRERRPQRVKRSAHEAER